MSTLIVGILYLSFMVWATTHALKDMKHSKCAGCSASSCASRIK